MSKILSYNKKTTGEGWIPLADQYSADEIGMIDDPNGGLSQQPRTAIPSPFAQMDLVKNAFLRLSNHKDLRGELMDEKLVANALDIAQLFFNYPELKGKLKLVEWQAATHLQMLQTDRQHRLLGDTIAMFLEQDKEAFNFEKMDRLFFLLYGNQVIGSTSPVTLFMASPNAVQGTYDLPIEQNVKLFDLWRPLYMRDERFIKYIYALFSAYPELKKLCGEMNAYLIRNFQLLRVELQNEILRDIANPEAYDVVGGERARSYLTSQFTLLDEGVQVLGIPFYSIRVEDTLSAIASSDFMICPTRTDVEKTQLPLVLQNNLHTTEHEPFKYITNNWDDSVVIKRDDYALPYDKRILPATNHQYPWLVDDDFFQPAIIKLDYTADRDSFFHGNKKAVGNEVDGYDFLLPLKPIFFQYFDVKDLWSMVGGRPMFELEHSKSGQVETIKAILRIPVNKPGKFITLQRIYKTATSVDLRYDDRNNHGYFITVPFAVSIFPFVRFTGINQYNIQLIDRALGGLDNYDIKLDFYKNGCLNALGDNEVVIRNRSLKAEKRVGSRYYKLNSDFDYINVSLWDERGNKAVEGIVCPKWADYVPGHEAFTFAVDFGTTNTHVESMKNNGTPEALSVASLTKNKLVATLYNGEHILYDVIIKQEFLSKNIGNDYGFPQRTVLSEPERLDAANVDNIIALSDANIPFIYEKESVGYGNRIVANLKWSTEAATSKRVKAYLTELALLMRTKVLLENGDITKTRLVWFYPLSMKIGNVRKMSEMWEKTFKEVFGIQVNEQNLIHLPESVAPYYYYKSSNAFRGSASTVASIDIGGGTSDVVVFESNAQYPTLLTSFRFAANVLFGDGFTDLVHGDTNPMLIKYVDYFKRLFEADDDKYGELHGILDDITSKRKSEDINAFLFSIANNKAVSNNDVFSYNLRLNEDETRKIIFIYFYAALIYYVANLMKHKALDMPRSVMFSGTGSKVLDIIGRQRELDVLTKAIFEKVYGESYGEENFSVVTERNEPKQITCRGALMQVSSSNGCNHIDLLNNKMDDYNNPLKFNYSMLSKEKLTYADMNESNVREQIVAEVRKFNGFFTELCDEVRVIDRFLVDNKALLQFKELVNNDLEHHLVKGWNFVNKDQNDKNGNDEIEDTVFFYPIIGAIRDNLIEYLR